MTNNQQPISPPSELMDKWEDDILNEQDNVDHVLDCAWRNGFQAGANAELDACCDVIERELICEGWGEDLIEDITEKLRAERRPKPPSLKERALEALQEAADRAEDISQLGIDDDLIDIIRRALEQLPDDQG
jgi:hypothetical protein